MATTIQKICDLLTAREIKHRISERNPNEVVFGIRMKEYRDHEGRDALMVVAGLMEDGEYFRIFAPSAYKAEGPNKAALLQAFMQCQWNTKLIQFEFDHEDGEVRPIIEFPLEDAELTEAQLHRCIGGLCSILDTYHASFMKALETGVIEMPTSSRGPAPVLPPSQVAESMLQSLRAAGRGEDDPLVQQLKRLLEEEAGRGSIVPDAF